MVPLRTAFLLYMLKKLWHKVTGKTAQTNQNKRILPFDIHGLNAEHISTAAEDVVKRLQKAGYQAYVVGGAVRDLLLGIEPKDFDVATNASPEQVRKLFRRSRIIGKRFPIVHVMMGAETIEVSTFRSGNKAVQNQDGRIMRDNAYGSIEEDAHRRDFTCNALYFDPISLEIVDFHHGFEAIQRRELVMIGKVEERYQEDPVRILRAVRLSSKLGFSVEERTAQPIAQLVCRLQKEPVARLFDETMKIVFSGYACACLQQMKTFGIQTPIYPVLDCLLAAHDDVNSMAMLALHNTDERCRADKAVSAGFVFATLLWGEVFQLWQRNQQNGMNYVPALTSAIAQVRERMENGWGVPQRFAAPMREIWQLQSQFEHRRGARPHRLLAQARFRAAYDFLSLRAQCGEVSPDLVSWWADFQAADDEQRQAMSANAPAPQFDGQRKSKKYRTRSPRRKPKSKREETV